MATKIETMADLLALLRVALSVQSARVSAINAFQEYVFDADAPVSGATVDQWEILNDLAMDLDYYEPDPVWRREDSSYYGNERLENEISEALKKLEGQ